MEELTLELRNICQHVFQFQMYFQKLEIGQGFSWLVYRQENKS